MTDWAAEAVTRGEVLAVALLFWAVFIFVYEAPDPRPNNRA